MGHTSIEMGKGQGDEGLKDFDDDNIDEMDLILCSALCCCNYTLYFECPECVGCSGKAEICCCSESFCCKLGTPAICCDAPPDHCCQLGLGCIGCGCKNADIACCLAQSQVCCFVFNAAYPPTDEVPLSCAVLGLACFPGFGCCKTLGELTGYDDAKRAAKKQKKEEKKRKKHAEANE